MTGDKMPRVMICFEHPGSDDAQSLIRQLDEDIRRRYPSLQETNGLHPADLIDPNFTFVIAKIDSSAVGCGALRRFEPGIGEIKRMFVRPEFRRGGIARRILEALESKAHELRYTSVLLETGIGQPEAIGLYKSAGYYQIAGFGEYVGNPFSVCFEKRLKVNEVPNCEN